MLRRTRKGQSTAEYAIVIGLVIAAAVAMQIYVKRQLQGKVKDAVDYNETTNIANGVTTANKQYEPYYQTTDITSTAARQESTQTNTGGQVVRTIDADLSTRTGTTNISDYTTAK